MMNNNERQPVTLQCESCNKIVELNVIPFDYATYLATNIPASKAFPYLEKADLIIFKTGMCLDCFCKFHNIEKSGIKNDSV